LPERGAGGRCACRPRPGSGELSDRIAAELGPEEGAILALAPLTRVRHRVAVEKAVAALFRAQQSLKEGLPLEFPAADIQEASGALAELVGEVAPEEVLDAIFSRFCVGK
jgi:tRNA modification GTPase